MGIVLNFPLSLTLTVTFSMFALTKASEIMRGYILTAHVQCNELHVK